jgi:hypothetical protein
VIGAEHLSLPDRDATPAPSSRPCHRTRR